MSKPFFLRVKAIAVTSIISAFVLLALPTNAQDEEGAASDTTESIEADVEDVEVVEVEEEEELPVGLTTGDLSIPEEELQLLAEPLTAEELQIEADAWIAILKARAHKISQTEVAVKRQNQLTGDQEKIDASLEQARTKLQTLEQQGGSEADKNAAELDLSEARRERARLLSRLYAFDLDKNIAEVREEAKHALTLNNAEALLQDARNQLASATGDTTASRKLLETLDKALAKQELVQEELESIVPGSPLYRSTIREVAQRRKEVAQAVDAVVASPDMDLSKPTEEEIEEGLKRQLVANATLLEANRSALIARIQVVLDELEKKGGDITAYDQYIKAVSGLDLDVTDAEGLGVRLLTWIQSEEGGIKFGIGALKFISILIAAAIISPYLGRLANALLSRVESISSLFRDFTVVVVKRGVLAVGLLLALASIGVSLGPVLALVGGLSFVLAFALQSNLGNFASGLLLLISKPFDVGDEVKVAGYWAYVDSISLANTKLKDFSGNIITLPNNTVWSGDIINYTHDVEKRQISMAINVKFSQDVDQVEQLWTDITSAHSKIFSQPGPSTFPWNGIYDSYISVSLSAWTATDTYWTVYAELLKILQKEIEERGIELSGPVQSVSLEEVPPKVIKQLASGADLA